MRIALVSPYDYPYPGGVTNHIRHLERHLTQWGHCVTILAPSTYDKEVLSKNVVKVSGSVLSIPTSGSKARLSLSPRIYRRVKAILKQGRFDVVHLQEPLLPVLPLAVLRHSQAVNVGTFHAYRETRNPGYRLARHILQPFFDKLDVRITVSEAAREAVSRYFPGDYRIIPNGIDVARFADPDLIPLPECLDQAPTILFLGRLEARKGLMHLLHALRHVQEQIPQVRLIVAGAYEKEDTIPYRAYVEAQRLKGVKFVGYVSEADKPRYYRSCDIYCAPSTGFESFGIVLLESMAAGTPVVASDIVGYRSVLRHGREGLLVEPGKPQALAKALGYLLKRPKLCQQMGANGYRKAQGYTWTKVATDIVNCYERALKYEHGDQVAKRYCPE
jgi:phosphatidylinositol alpha-mannosyltransferase